MLTEMLAGGFPWKWIQLNRMIRKSILEIEQGSGKEDGGMFLDPSKTHLLVTGVLPAPAVRAP